MNAEEKKIERREMIGNIPIQEQNDESLPLHENIRSQIDITDFNDGSADLQLNVEYEENKCINTETNLSKESIRNTNADIDESILEVAGKYVHDISQTGSYLNGYIDGKENLEEFLSEYRVVAKNSFPIRDSHHWYKEKNHLASFQKSKLLWNLSSGVMPVPSFNMPFCVEGYVIRDCFNGVTPIKRKLKIDEEKTTDEQCLKRKRKSRKLGCKASLKIKQVTVFPEFKIDPSSVFSGKGLRKLKANQLKQLRLKLKAEENVTCLSRFCIEVPLSSAHSHSVTSASTYNRLHPVIIQKIQELVQTGFRDISAIKQQLMLFVQTELFKGSVVVPESTDRTYYPFDKDIKNHLRSSMKRMEEVSRKQKALIEELQNIASWACQCSDTKQLDFIFNKMSEIRKTYNLTSCENMCDSTSEYNDMCPAEDVAYIQTCEDTTVDCNDELNPEYHTMHLPISNQLSSWCKPC